MNVVWKTSIGLILMSSLSMLAQTPDQGCSKIHHMAAAARAKTIQTLRHYEPADGYQAQLILTARSLELDPTDKEVARRFLELLPRSSDDPRQAIWLDLPQMSECKVGGTPESDLKPLFVLQYHLPRLAARAVLRAPESMQAYVSYGLIANWPDSDYAVQMRRVCRAKHPAFVQAIKDLQIKDREFFISRIFNPEGCHTVFFPEQ